MNTLRYYCFYYSYPANLFPNSERTGFSIDVTFGSSPPYVRGFTGKSLGRFMTYDEESGKFMSEEEYSTGEGMYKGVLYKLFKDLKGNRLDFNTYNGKYEIQQKINIRI